MKNRNRIMKLLLAVCLLTAVFSFDCANAWTDLRELKCGDMVWCNWFDDGRMDIYVGDYHSTAPMWDFSTDFRPDYFDPRLLSDYKLTQLRFCEGISHVGNYAFYRAKDLETVTFANDSVTSIGNGAFEDCRSLVSITLPAKLNSIGMRAFNNCSRLGMLILPESLTTIGDYAFIMCSNLQTLTIPDSVTSIGANAFTSCGENWKSFTLQCSCRNTYVPTYAEENGIPVLINHHFVDGVCADCGAGESIIDGGECGLCDSDGNFGKDVVWSLYNSGRMVIHGSDDHPCKMADLTTAPFVPWNSYREFITSVEITGKVTNVGRGAFNGSSKLKSVSICDSVTSIDYGAFAECYNLTDVSLSNNLTYLGDLAFYNCSALPSITLPDTLKIIDYFVFSDCYSLQTITIPDGVESIGDYAFYACSSLTEISIPDSVETFGFNVFMNHHADLTITCGCASAARAYVDEKGIKTSLIHHYADNFCTGCGEPEYYTDSGTCGNQGNNIAWFFTEDGKLYILGTGAMADYASEEAVPWRELRGSVASVEVKSGVTGIGDYAFYGCVNLTDVSIPDSIADIGDYAFADCTSLTEISIPDSVTSCGTDVFYDHNTNLKIICVCDSPARAYADENSIQTSLIHHYADGICTGCGGKEYLSTGDCGDSVTYKLHSDGTLTVSGTGRMADYTSTDNPHPWYDYRSSVRTVVIESGVTYIGNSAFYGLFNLTSVSIANSVTEIGEYAFSTSRMPDIEIPNSVTKVGKYAFQDCGSLTEVTVPGSILTIPYDMFYRCRNLKKVTIGNGVQEIGMSAFNSCESLTEVSIPNSVTTVGFAAFMDCEDLAELAIPEGVKSIGERAFFSCASLTNVSIPDSVTEIGKDAFEIRNENLMITCGCTSDAKTYADNNGILTSLLHVEVIDPYLPATRTAFGLTEGSHCGRCEEVVTPQEEIAPLTDIPVVELPRDTKAIEDEAFAGSAIECAVLPNGCESICSKAFANCALLKIVEIPESVTDIDPDAFVNTQNVVIVTTEGSTAEVFAKQHGLYCRAE